MNMNNEVKKAVIGIGTNIGDRAANISAAVSSLGLLPRTSVLRTSQIYETSPVGYKQQDNFYNIVAEIETSLSPHALLGACLGIEAAMGRERSIKNGPRIIDLDVLLFEGFTSDCQELKVPHPEILRRAFVIVPLTELYPDGRFFDFSFSFTECDEKDTVISVGTVYRKLT